MLRKLSTVLAVGVAAGGLALASSAPAYATEVSVPIPATKCVIYTQVNVGINPQAIPPVELLPGTDVGIRDC